MGLYMALLRLSIMYRPSRMASTAAGTTAGDIQVRTGKRLGSSASGRSTVAVNAARPTIPMLPSAMIQ